MPYLLLTIALRFACGKKNLVKHQKVSKYYDHDCLQNFLLIFMSLLTAPVVIKNHNLAENYFIFLKNALEQT